MIQEMVRGREQEEAEREEADEKLRSTFRANVGLMLVEWELVGKHFGKRYTQGSLAEKIGTSSQNLANWRNGTEPSLTQLARLERAWDLDFTKVIEGGSFFRILTGKEMGLYRKSNHLIILPPAGL